MSDIATEITTKMAEVYSSERLDSLKMDMVRALSSMHLLNDCDGISKFFAAYVNMVDRTNGYINNSARECVTRAESDLEVLSHAAHWYALYGDLAYHWASTEDLPAENNIYLVRKFYRECIKEKTEEK
jgi:hypothetical protein